MGGGWSGAAGTEDGPCLQTARSARALRPRDVSTQRMERIVGDEAAPDEAPQSFDHLAWIAPAGGLMQRVEKAGAGGFENSEELFFALCKRLKKRTLLREQR